MFVEVKLLLYVIIVEISLHELVRCFLESAVDNNP